ncbi:MAG: xanthine dehydrogenase family protein molybdopterin-binding subunit [Peptococcales bacterium]|jgi:CO/xanthine dehydrogenase Mo-binding subunit
MTYKWIGKPIPREDALDKATGKTKYMTDLEFPGMLWGKIIRSGIPHGRIADIDTSEAENYPGVVSVVTYKDVPGLNGYGIHIQDQPVFCQDKVRYEGDAVAGVIAETKEIAVEAAAKIKVKYDFLPGIFDVEEAMRQENQKIHEKGNVLLEANIKNGNVEKAFSEADLIVEKDYFTPYQFPAYLELEGGVAEYKDGIMTIWCGSQYPTQDQVQLSMVLGIPEEKIRIISNPVGGAFGGKDDLTIQPQLAVMAYKVGKPVKLVNTREESNITSWKRHSMYIKMKTAVKKDGTLLANKVKIVSDTGAYAGLGAAVLTNALNHACGSYKINNVDLKGYCVYTNNSPASAMRGFGVPQVNFAVESQLDIIGQKLGIDPITIRLKNALSTGDKGAIGQTLSMSMGIKSTLERAKNTTLWSNREEIKKQVSRPWKKRGIGIATSIKGVGLGLGLPDYSAAEITLTNDGSYIIGVGCPEIGQGNHIAFKQIAAEILQCSIDSIIVIQGDSFTTPDSGVTAASRTIYAAGNAILLAAQEIKQKIKEFLAKQWSVPAEEIQLDGVYVNHKNRRLSIKDVAALAINQGVELKASSYFDMPTADKGVEGLYGIPSLLYGATTQIALVEVDTLTGFVEVLESVCIPDAGKVINLQGLEGQAEGGTVMGMGYALTEKAEFKEGYIKTDNFDTYLIPTSLDAPEITVIPVEELESSGPFGAKGIAESLSTTITSSIINGIYDAVGVRITHLPATMEKVLSGITNKNLSGKY